MDAIETIPLGAEFRFVHEPLGNSSDMRWERFVGRAVELEDFVSRVVLSNGGAFLLTGYRGVGKTSFVNRVIHQVRERLPEARTFVGEARVVDIAFNFARPLEPVELLHHIVRGLHNRLADLDVLQRLDATLRDDIKLAVTRTSATIAMGSQSEVSRQLSTGDIAVPGMSLPLLVKLQRTWRSQSSRNITYLAYDEKAAEHDLISIAQRLVHGYLEPASRLGQWPPWKPRRRVRLKVVMVFDELDKLDDDAVPADRASLDRVLGTLKNLFTASGLTFIFVAGKALHDRWLDDLSRGDSVYESVFAHAHYLPGMWTDADLLCDSLAGAADVATAESGHAYDAFRKYLAFKGRGIPRRTIRGFNEYVKWGHAPPRLEFGQADVRRFRFYAGLLESLVNGEEQLLGQYRGEGSIEQLDKRRLGIYYATDWIIQRQQREFTLDDLVAASRSMSRQITPVEEAAPAELQRLLDVLVRTDHVERVDAAPQTVVAGVPVARPIRYRLPRRRLLELGAFLGVFEQEANALFRSDAPPPPPARPPVGPPAPLAGPIVGADPPAMSWRTRYEVLAKIGHGGMSAVYRARDRRTGLEVAVKEMHAELLESDSIRARALREVELLKTLVHPNVVRVLDVYNDPTSVALVMDLVAGSTLVDVLRQGAIHDAAICRRLMTDIASAVAHVHRMGIVWRDPKPSNIIVTHDGRVVVLDFGISRQLGLQRSDTEAGMVIGTPGYMSPEQVRGEPVETSSDIFGLGALFFEIVTGRRAFEGSFEETLAKVLTSAPPAPSSIDRAASEFDDIVLRCLAAKPAERPTADEVRSSVESGAADAATLASYIAGLNAVSARREDEGTAMRQERPASSSVSASPTVPPPASVATPVPATRLVPRRTEGSADAAATSGPRLEFVGSERVVPLRDFVTIGRSTENYVVVDDKAVSRYACTIRRGEGGADSPDAAAYFLDDRNSRNGVLLNGERVTGSARLHDGDVIALGGIRLRVRLQ